MRVVLTKDVVQVGRMGNVLDVKDGFARNFLLPKGLARVADKTALSEAAARAENIVCKHESHKDRRDALVARLSDEALLLRAKANEQGHLFAGISEDDIKYALRKKGISDIDKISFSGLPIKSVGEHEVFADIDGKKVSLKATVEQKQ